MSPVPPAPTVSLEACYCAVARGGSERALAAALLARRHWLYEAGEFDPLTGAMLPEALGQVCARLRREAANQRPLPVRDRLYRVLQHVRGPLEELLHGLHEGLVRVHASLPLRAVRELDTSAFFALSRRPGRTVREKLADRPYLWAVERRWTVDTAENRLVKALCARLADLLRARTSALGAADEPWIADLRLTLDAWLFGPVAREIGRWENLPPNNLLLQHRDYRRIWDAWSWLETLDDDIRRDHELRAEQWATMLLWSMVARIDGMSGIRVLEQPCALDYEGFTLVPGRSLAPAAARVEGLFVPPADLRRSTEPFSLELRAGSVGGAGPRLLLNPPGRRQLELAFEVAGDRVRVCFGDQTRDLDPSPTTAVGFATTVVSKEFGRAGAAASESLRAAAPGATGAIDLCTLLPRFATEGGRGVLPIRLLWQSWRQPGREASAIDLGSTRAIALGDPDVETVSILYLLTVQPQNAPAAVAQAARAFAAVLRDQFPTESLTYLVPDGTDEFALGSLRWALNAAFREAAPLPRSIGAAFEWQSSSRFAGADVRPGDLLLVLDTVGDSATATPLLARWSEELARRVPETRGVSWERCPSLVGESGSTSIATAADLLEEEGCPFASELARLCGLQGLLDEVHWTSWQGPDGAWFTASAAFACTVGEAARTTGPWAAMAPDIEQECAHLHRDARLFVLVGPEGRWVDTQRLRFRGAPVSTAREPHAGALTLRRWQARAGELPLWRDRLPELSIRIVEGGRPKRFHLVGESTDSTIEPRRGKAVRIPVSDTFVLPAGEPHYRFPLLQGPERQESRWEAFLASPAFPLTENLPVELELWYSYGSDAPYDLVFTNRDRGLKVRAEWRARGDEDGLPSHHPATPPPEPWSRFERYPRRDSSEMSNLLDWITDGLERIERQVRALEAPRYQATVLRPWKRDKNGGRYTFARGIGLKKDVFVHENEFLVHEQAEGVTVGTILRLDVEQLGDGRTDSGRHITAEPGATDGNVVLCRRLEQLLDTTNRGLRFPFLTVWASGNSLDDPDAPEPFREAVRRAVPTLTRLVMERDMLTSLAELADLQRRVSDGALFLLCCLHRDAPHEVAHVLRQALAESGPGAFAPRYLGRHVALVLGDGRLDWQCELLSSVLAVFRRSTVSLEVSGPCLQVLGMALWRCPSVLDRLAEPDLRLLVEQIVRVLKAFAHHDGRRTATSLRALADHLELVLALLRTRGSDDLAIRALLAPGRPETRELARVVDRVIDQILSNRGLRLESRLRLGVEKPAALHDTPDLLYALRLYLTGDDGAASIRVHEVTRDEAPDARREPAGSA